MKLLRADVEDLEIEEFYEGETPEYAILSHTWLADSQEITYGKHLGSEVRLKEGWRKIQGSKQQAQKDGLKYVWIDTLCINKSSSVELAEAINSMFRYYREAKVCYIYLNDLPDLAGTINEEPLDPENVPEMVSNAENHGANAPIEPTPAYLHTTGALPEDAVQAIDWELRRRPAPAASPQDLDASESRNLTAQEPAEAERENDVERAIVLPRPGDGEMQSLVNSHQRGGPEPLRPAEEAELRSILDLEAFRLCRWFGRGWTLQELLAPTSIKLYSESWTEIPLTQSVVREISTITRINITALTKSRTLNSFSIAQRMSWAADRRTKRIEDRAYSLLGILEVNLPVIYGEGKLAFRRLQEELLRRTQDQTIFAFHFPEGRPQPRQGQQQPPQQPDELENDEPIHANGQLLADSPDDFRNSWHISPVRGPLFTKFNFASSEVEFTTLHYSWPLLHFSSRGMFWSHKWNKTESDSIWIAFASALHVSRMALLNIDADKLRPGKFHVATSWRRWQLLDCWDPRADGAYLTKISCTVLCNYREPKPRLTAKVSPKMILLFRGGSYERHREGLLSFDGVSPAEQWLRGSRAFSLPLISHGDNWVGEVKISWSHDSYTYVDSPGSHAGTLHVSYRKVKGPLRVADLRIKFDRSLLPFPRWHVFGDIQWPTRSTKWNPIRLFLTPQVLLAYPKQQHIAPDGRRMPTVVVEAVCIGAIPSELFRILLRICIACFWLLVATVAHLWLLLVLVIILTTWIIVRPYFWADSTRKIIWCVIGTFIGMICGGGLVTYIAIQMSYFEDDRLYFWQLRPLTRVCLDKVAVRRVPRTVAFLLFYLGIFVGLPVLAAKLSRVRS